MQLIASTVITFLLIGAFFLGKRRGKIDREIIRWEKLKKFLKNIDKSKSIPNKQKLVILTIFEETFLSEKELKQIYTKKIPNEG